PQPSGSILHTSAFRLSSTIWYRPYLHSVAINENSSDEYSSSTGTPKWRMAPSPKGPYWKEGMKLGYQDVGSWTFLKSSDEKKRLAAWLYAQFVTSKSVSLKKTIVGLTPIRESDINSKEMTALAPKLGGLVEFYRSP
ncbi:ABC transporter, periplasmic substrate-binding protein, partial [Pseudomonas syringae pv. maculicola]